MFTPITRLLLIIFSSAAAIAFAQYDKWPFLILATLISLALLWGYFKQGTIALALNKLRKNKFDEAERILLKTQKPEKLLKTQQSYYFFIKGIIAHNKDQFSEAEALLTMALENDIRLENDRAMAFLALADISLINGDKKQAKEHFLKLKNLKVYNSLMPSVRQMQSHLNL